MTILQKWKKYNGGQSKWRLEDPSSEEKLENLELFILGKRWIRGNMIEMYRIMHWLLSLATSGMAWEQRNVCGGVTSVMTSLLITTQK